jgi:hypothetical protein
MISFSKYSGIFLALVLKPQEEVVLELMALLNDRRELT